MKTSAVLLLCMLGAAVFSTVCCSSKSGPESCCYKFFHGRLPRGKIQSYILTDDRCPKPGIILKTIRGLNVCVDPNQSWVKDLMWSMDERWEPPALTCRSPECFERYPNIPSHHHSNGPSYLNSPTLPDNCCFKFYPGRIPREKIQSYSLGDNRCPKPAIILVTKKNLKVCVDLYQCWVQDLMRSLDDGWEPPALECRRPAYFPRYSKTPKHHQTNGPSYLNSPTHNQTITPSYLNSPTHNQTITPSYLSSPTPEYMCIPIG